MDYQEAFGVVHAGRPRQNAWATSWIDTKALRYTGTRERLRELGGFEFREIFRVLSFRDKKE
jgi:hypothetical protein